jgi:hypothetical protein
MLFRPARKVTAIVFSPRNSYLGVSDVLSDRLGKVRAWLGFALIAYLGLYRAFSASGNGIAGWANAFLSGEGVSVAVFLGVATLVSVAIIVATQSGCRGRAARRLGMFPLTLLAYVGLIGAVVAALWANATFLDPIPNHDSWRIIGGVVVIVVVVGYGGAWIITASYQVVSGSFRADDAHPLLAPIAVPVTAIILALISSATPPSELPGPFQGVAWVVRFAGPLTLAVLAGLRVYRLRQGFPDAFPFLTCAAIPAKGSSVAVAEAGNATGI